MPILNIACPICTEPFQNSEDIYSTSCGHLYHYDCMRDWQSRETSCAQCRSNNPTTHKLYLSFENSDENPTETNDLKVKLQSANEEIQALYEQIRKADENYLHLQEQCTSSGELIRELEERIHQSNDSETNFLNLQGQYTEAESLLSEMLENVQLLTIDNEQKTKELNLQSLEMETLKTLLDDIESQSSDFILIEKIKFLEQKLKHISAEFEKEVTISTQLSIDKMKLESYVEQMKLEANDNKSGCNSYLPSKDVKSRSLNNSTLTNPKQLFIFTLFVLFSSTSPNN